MADEKITQLPVTTTLAGTDLLPTVVNPSSVPETKTITKTNLFAPTEAEIASINTMLGTSPKGNYADVATRLNALEYTIPAQGRLTLSSGEPFSASDVTNAVLLYYTPYIGNTIALYSGRWTLYNFTEISTQINGLNINTNYDVFAYYSMGVLLETVAWTNDTTRATALTYQNGVLVKSGSPSKRYLGTIRTTSAVGGKCDDTASKRFVWNYYNQKPKALTIYKSGSHSYTTGVWRYYNNDTTICFEFVCGEAQYTSMGLVGETNNGGYVGIGQNGLGIPTGAMVNNNNAATAKIGGGYTILFANGYNIYYALEYGSTNATFLVALIHANFMC